MTQRRNAAWPTRVGSRDWLADPFPKHCNNARAVWEAAHGPIPEGAVIHHRDEDPGNDALENLQMLETQEEHNRIHRGWEKREDGWWKPRDGVMVKHKGTNIKRKVAKTVKPHEFDALLAVAKYPYRAMMLLQYAVGMRPGEVCKLRTVDMDLPAGEARTPEDGKTGQRDCYFDVNGRAAEALREWETMRGPGPYYFGGPSAVKINTYTRTVGRYSERAGTRHVKPYAFRHTYATEVLRAGAHAPDIAAALGNAVFTTMRYYLHGDPDELLEMNAGR